MTHAPPTAATTTTDLAVRWPALPTLPVQVGDWRGLGRLGITGVLGVTDVVEAVHAHIGSAGGLLGTGRSGRTRGLTGLVYGTVRGMTHTVGQALELAATAAAHLLPAPEAAPTLDPNREAWLAALNGVWGDHLAASANPLALTMALHVGGRLATPPVQPTGKLLVLVHGLAMNDLQWQRGGHDHGQALAAALGYTPIYAHYNSGRHISQNGRDLAAALAHLVSTWPVPVQELTLVGHSMGGLVARSACHIGQGQAWAAHLKNLVFLATPHHGAPLERGGRLLDAALGWNGYLAPFAKLGQTRSAGITDLRFGNLQDADWQHRGGHAQTRDDRLATPLPARVRSFAVAATGSTSAQVDQGVLRGDGLVPVASALGEHTRPELNLQLPKTNRLVITQANHWDVLNRPEVADQLLRWLA